MKKTLVAGAFALLAGAAVTMRAEAADALPGWYAGVDLGRSQLRPDDKRDTAYALDAGYRFNSWLALEGGYVDFGRYSFDSDTLDGRLKAHAYRLSAVGIAPVGAGFSVYGKAGIFDSRAEFDGGSPAGLDVGGTRHHTDGTFGLGASYDFTRTLAANVEWNRYLKVAETDATGRGDIDLVTAGLAYRF